MDQTSPIIRNSLLIEKIAESHDVIIISSSTGSGKTVYLPKILIDKKIARKIIISQIRRVACISAATFSSNMFRTPIGTRVGYVVRFEKNCSKNTQIKYVTDGILLNETIEDPFLSKYDCVILDEVHSRSIPSDILIGLLKKAIDKRKKMKLIFMSATNNSKLLNKFFGLKCGIINISSRHFGLAILHTKIPLEDYIFSITALVLKISTVFKLEGNILIFLPGLREIKEIYRILGYFFKKLGHDFPIISLMATSSIEDQRKALKNSSLDKKKIILCTNVAETSLTIPNVLFVVDCGYSKQKLCNWKSGIDVYRILPVSKSEAVQRSGRTGREKFGICYRMYTRSSFQQLKNRPVPDFNRSEISWFMLQLLSSETDIFVTLDFLEAPPIWTVKRAVETLFILGLIDKRLKLTKIGKLVSFYPIEVKYGRAIIETILKKDSNSSKWIAGIASILSLGIDNKKIFAPLNGEIDEKLKNEFGEHIFYGKMFFISFFSSSEIQKKNLARINNFGFQNENVINKIYIQLRFTTKILQSSAFSGLESYIEKPTYFYERVNYFLTSGLFFNLAIKHASKKYNHLLTGILANSQTNRLFRNERSKFVIFDKIVFSGFPKIICTTPVKLKWIIHYGFNLYR